MDIVGQIDEGVRRIKARYNCDHFIAYFQPATNTYAPVERLREVYGQALAHPKTVALAIGTRPDCAPDEVLELVGEIARRTYLSVEFGVQSIHDRSLAWLNCGRRHDAFVDAMKRSRGRGFGICAHVILGIPGETHQDMMATARELGRLGVDSVKIHNLYAVKNTPLAEQVLRGDTVLMELEEYVRMLVDFMELLPPKVTIERTSGSAPPDLLVAPAWCLDRPGVMAALRNELRRRDTWQGRLFPA